MDANLKTALGYILDDEGPELNVGGSEPGGGSKYGVSMTVLAEWNKAHGLSVPTLSDLGRMTPDLAGAIYTARFATPIMFGRLPGGVDYRLLDVCVNLGIAGGVSLLQVVLGIWQAPGAIDDATVMAISGVPAQSLVMQIGAAWIAKKHESPNWFPSPITKTGYGHGWSNRNARATARALSLIGAGS